MQASTAQPAPDLVKDHVFEEAVELYMQTLPHAATLPSISRFFMLCHLSPSSGMAMHAFITAKWPLDLSIGPISV